MAAMAVDADRGIPISGRQSTRMVAVQLLLGLLRMARSGIVCCFPPEIRDSLLAVISGMRKLLDAAVACRARLRAVD